MNDIQEHILICARQIKKRPILFLLYITTATSISIAVANLHNNKYTVGTRILVEDTSRYSSILSGYYTPKSNIKETIENLKEASLSKDFINRSIEQSEIDQNWDKNKPKLFHITAKIAEMMGKSPKSRDENDRLIAFVRKKVSFYRENNTIVLHFSWHNKTEAKRFIDSLQDQIIKKNKQDQKDKSKNTIEILTSIKTDIDKSIENISLRIDQFGDQKKS